MREVWLLSNRRAVLMGMLLPAIFAVIGFVLLAGTVTSLSFVWVRIVGGLIAVVAVFVLLAMLQQLRRPRIAYQEGNLLIFLSLGPPFIVPLDVVECFLLGQGPAFRPGSEADHEQAATVVVRLAEREADYARRDVKPALGAWCDSHITIRGTWCEPLDEDVVRRLNRRLAEVNRERVQAL